MLQKPNPNTTQASHTKPLDLHPNCLIHRLLFVSSDSDRIQSRLQHFLLLMVLRCPSHQALLLHPPSSVHRPTTPRLDLCSPMWLYWLVREPNAGEKRRTAVAGGDGEAGGVQAPRVIWPSLLLFWMRCDAMRCVGAEAQAPLSLSLCLSLSLYTLTPEPEKLKLRVVRETRWPLDVWMKTTTLGMYPIQ